MNFYQKLDRAVEKNNSLLCIGLDAIAPRQFAFNKKIIDATHDLVCAYKPNSAFYEARGAKGIEELKNTCEYLRKNYPHIVIILDAKRADIGSTNAGYVSYAFDYLKADAITLHPYLGKEALQPFLDWVDRGCIILCRTSNSGSGEFQDEMYQKVAQNVAGQWNANNNCAVVVGATYPEELGIVRKIIGEMPILLPGVGAQGGDLAASMRAGLNSQKAGLIINSSRGILFSQDPRAEAEKLRAEINLYR